MIKKQEDNSKKKARFGLAKASERIFARFLDIIFLLILSIGWACLVFLTDKGFDGTLSGFYVQQPFRYLLFALLCIVCYILYFIFLPYFWKGQTLGKKIFKLAIYNQICSRFIWNLFKKEFFVWGIISLVELSFAITLFIVGYVTNNGPYNANQIIQLMFKYDSSNSYYSYAIIFASLFTIAGLVAILNVISVAIHSGHQAFSDKISNTVVVKLIDISGSDKENELKNQKNRKLKRNLSLPGAVIDSVHDTIDSLDNNSEE